MRCLEGVQISCLICTQKPTQQLLVYSFFFFQTVFWSSTGGILLMLSADRSVSQNAVESKCLYNSWGQLAVILLFQRLQCSQIVRFMWQEQTQSMVDVAFCWPWPLSSVWWSSMCQRICFNLHSDLIWWCFSRVSWVNNGVRAKAALFTLCLPKQTINCRGKWNLSGTDG